MPQTDHGTIIYAQTPQGPVQQLPVLGSDVITTNPAAGTVQTVQPVVPLLPANPVGPSSQIATAGQTGTGADPQGAGGQVDPQVNIASKVSFMSLRSGPRSNM